MPMAKAKESAPQVEELKRRFVMTAHVIYGRDIDELTPHEIYMTIAATTRELLSENWIKTNKTYQEKNAKQVYYFSIEFLLGRLLNTNLINLGVKDLMDEALGALNLRLARSLTEEPEKLKELILREKYSRLPVYAGSPDRIVGILQTKDYLQLILKKKDPDISALMKLTYDVPPEIKLDELFEGLGRRRTHMAIVIDMSGNALGFVTMEEILEELVGEIYDEDDASEQKGVGA